MCTTSEEFLELLLDYVDVSTCDHEVDDQQYLDEIKERLRELTKIMRI